MTPFVVVAIPVVMVVMAVSVLARLAGGQHLRCRQRATRRQRYAARHPDLHQPRFLGPGVLA
jgi:hypothetical protein